MSIEEKYQILEMLAKHEEKIGELYQIYAEKFVDSKDFWSALATEESIHAGWINTLQNKIKDRIVSTKQDKNKDQGSSIDSHLKEIQSIQKHALKIDSIQASINSINNHITDIQVKDIPLVEAVSIALNIEKSLIENKFFEVFEGDSSELKVVLQDLTTTTEAHRERIQKFLNEKK